MFSVLNLTKCRRFTVLFCSDNSPARIASWQSSLATYTFQSALISASIWVYNKCWTPPFLTSFLRLGLFCLLCGEINYTIIFILGPLHGLFSSTQGSCISTKWMPSAQAKTSRLAEAHLESWRFISTTAWIKFIRDHEPLSDRRSSYPPKVLPVSIGSRSLSKMKQLHPSVRDSEWYFVVCLFQCLLHYFGIE